MRVAVVVVVAVGCGSSGPAPRSPHESMEIAFDRIVDNLIDLSSRGDARGLARMLDRPLGYGGMWFPDTDCRRQLGPTGTIPAAGIEIFAGCLATLSLHRSERKHPYPDVAILTYDPGIEIEVFFGPDEDGEAKVRFIGYVGRSGPRDALPTVTEVTMLAHRNEVAPITLDDATRAEVERERAHLVARDKIPVFTWFRLCIDATGAITGLYPRLTSSIAAQEAFATQVRTWTFWPFALGTQPSPVCSLLYVGSPQDTNAQRGLLPPPTPLEHATSVVLVSGAFGRPRSGVEWTRPAMDDFRQLMRHRMKGMMASVFYCIDERGRVSVANVTRPSGFPRWDNRLRSGFPKMTYAPYLSRGRPVRACTHMNFATTLRY